MITLPGFTARHLPPAAVLRDVFSYDPDSGILTRRKTGKAITRKDKERYILVAFKKTTYLAHRVIWVIWYGSDPIGPLDHINGLRHDNRIHNLRCISPAQNTQNRKLQKSNTSGAKGVYWHKPKKRWAAQIKVAGKKINLGRYLTLEQAKEAYQQASKRFHGEYGQPG